MVNLATNTPLNKSAWN